MTWIWVAIVVFMIVGIALIVWRKQVTPYQEIVFANRMHPGCAVVEGLAFILLALVFYLLYRRGLLAPVPLR